MNFLRKHRLDVIVVVIILSVALCFTVTASAASVGSVLDWSILFSEAGYEYASDQLELADNFCDELYLMYMSVTNGDAEMSKALVASYIRANLFVLETTPSGYNVCKLLREAGNLVMEKMADESFSPFYIENSNGDVIDTDVTVEDVNVVGGETFNDIIARLNEQYSPKENPDTVLASWFWDRYANRNILNSSTDRKGEYITVLYDNGLWCDQGWYEVYMTPFYMLGDKWYYNDYQYHWYFSEPIYDEETQTNIIMTNCEVYNYNTGETEVFTDLFDRAKYGYISFTVPGYFTGKSIMYEGHSSITAIEKNQFIVSTSLPSEIPSSRQYYSSEHGSITIPLTEGTGKGFNLGSTQNLETYNEDIGYICSSQPISFTYPIQHLPSDTYVTINGDNIYNYTISNPDTGESTTINNYINNNYNFPDDGDDDSGDNGGSGGSMSGDITVSGGVEVGGQVDVNINVNVGDNGGTGDSGTTESQPSYIDGVNTNLTDYLDKTPVVADGFIAYLTDFFKWLPAEVLGVIMLGLVVAVWCRLAGR